MITIGIGIPVGEVFVGAEDVIGSEIEAFGTGVTATGRSRRHGWSLKMHRTEEQKNSLKDKGVWRERNSM